ncbi:Uncharacterised protein [Citrobacter freundii]|nr:Uncharacterised protein [Citrobacter freundii]
MLTAEALQTHLERWERHIDTVLAETSQNQLVDFVAQRHTMPHLSGINTQLEDLNPLLQVNQEDFWRRVIDNQRAALCGSKQDLRNLLAVSLRRCRDG